MRIIKVYYPEKTMNFIGMDSDIGENISIDCGSNKSYELLWIIINGEYKEFRLKFDASYIEFGRFCKRVEKYLNSKGYNIEFLTHYCPEGWLD